MSAKPNERCPVCGYTVVVASDAVGRFAAWCPCASVSPADAGYRGVGYGDDAAAALESWRTWTPERDKRD